MQPSKNTLSDIKNPQTAWLWYGLSALVVGIDQLSKVYFENNFQLYQTEPSWFYRRQVCLSQAA